MTTKERHRLKLLEYLSNPEHEWPTRIEMSGVLGLKDPSGVYKVFNTPEISALEAEALEMRRKQYAAMLARVDAGVLKKAAEGDSASAKLAYQRFEAWSEKQQVDHNVTITHEDAIEALD